jgi:ABC-type oligopeptide transport system substrate-binding subunit
VYAQEIVSAYPLRADRRVIRLSKPVPDLTARLTMHFFCPVPLGLPNDPEGIGAPFSGAGPYYIASFERGRRLVALRNPYYRGSRPQHVDRIVVDVVEAEAAVPLVERGQADYTPIGPSTRTPGAVRERLIGTYGVNRSQYFVVRAPTVYWLALNTERPLFKDNVQLRQAINFAVDRQAIIRTRDPAPGTQPTSTCRPRCPASATRRSIRSISRPWRRRGRWRAGTHGPARP